MYSVRLGSIHMLDYFENRPEPSVVGNFNAIVTVSSLGYIDSVTQGSPPARRVTPTSRALPSVWTTPLAVVALALTRVPVTATSLKMAGRVAHVSVSFNATGIHVGSHVDTVLKACIASACVCV